MNSSNLGGNTVCLPYKLIKLGYTKKSLQLKEVQFSGNNKGSSQKWKFKETHSESMIRKQFSPENSKLYKAGLVQQMQIMY